MLRLLLSFALFATASTAALADVKRKDGSVIECYCTDKFGSRHEIGDIICLTVDDRSYMAKCIMAQNVPHWRDQKLGCLSSEAPKMTPKPSDTAIAQLLR
ncbi:hypothetical protein [Ahrensia sp. R2A130]|uniref:hypothetical protein n=1 Tax=Ahrensia sp. R2A130 TaxID=744979 RepID=UPI0001E0D0C9|nr:hypothetical protein [Ahrensia sp. R2A130]EFL90874.1 conserved hypothetical protein [Ahrensia sp. R2A130]